MICNVSAICLIFHCGLSLLLVFLRLLHFLFRSFPVSLDVSSFFIFSFSLSLSLSLPSLRFCFLFPSRLRHLCLSFIFLLSFSASISVSLFLSLVHPFSSLTLSLSLSLFLLLCLFCVVSFLRLSQIFLFPSSDPLSLSFYPLFVSLSFFVLFFISFLPLYVSFALSHFPFLSAIIGFFFFY